HPNNLFREYNGAFIENYVCLELIKSLNPPLFYWNSAREAEVDFVFQWNNEIIPLEVKSGTNKNMKGFRVFEEKYHPRLLLRTSPRNYIVSGNFRNIPLHAIFGLKHFF
ncbi:MAG TPA: DUF4143 domain-containing protein, partial [Saprospiraceae bacterium]|nr:DUF4143 domain-containing protein [Saprospiraceae bacterium]